MGRGDGEAARARAVAEQLAAGLEVPDARFDRLLGHDLQLLAGLHFTPVTVARRAAAWLAEAGEVADLGAGAGKLCLVGAATTGARFTGIERRAGLVALAARLARDMGLDRAQFVHGDLLTVPLRRFRAFYVYDPFSEAEAEEDERLDAAPPAADRRASAEALLARLEEAPSGSRLAIFCGLGGPEPSGWRRVAREPQGERGDPLDLWEK